MLAYKGVVLGCKDVVLRYNGVMFGCKGVVLVIMVLCSVVKVLCYVIVRL